MHRRALPFLLLSIATLLLCGCAAQTAYRQGQDLLRQGRTFEALPALEEAARLAPDSLEYRAGLAYARERASAAHLLQAESLRRQQRLDEAEQVLRSLLVADPSHERAAADLRALERQRRLDAWTGEAQAAANRQDAAAAHALLRDVLLEDPRHEAATRLASQLDEAQRAREAMPEAALAEAYRKPITLEFRDAPLRNVFDLLSRTAGLNFLFDKDVRTDQKTSIFLKNATIESAVHLILLTHQLEQRVLDAHTVLVYPNTAAKQKDYQPLVVRSFYLAHAEAKAVAATLKQLLKLREVVSDDKLNLLIVRDSPEAVRLAEKLVALHDVGEPEVMLEVEILEVKRTRLLDLGIRWPEQLALTPLAPGASGTPLTLADLQNLSSRNLGATLGPTTITARQVDTDANILANPRIRARNREKARILIGERVPNITTTSTSSGFVAESVNYVDVGLKLDVEPTVFLDGEVAIKVALEVSNIISQLQTKSGSIAYQIGTRTAQTVLRLKDGENQVLAGLISDQDRRTANKVPALGDVPVLGRLFGGHADDGSKTEIVLSITPRILRNLQRPGGGLLEFDSGTESSLGVRAVHGAAVQGAGGAQAKAAALASPAPAHSSAQAPAPSSAPAAAPPPTTASPATAMATPGYPVLGGSDGLALGGTASAGPANLTWQGPGQVRVGDSFSLQLGLQSDQPLHAVPVVLGFDPRVLQVLAVTEGDFLRQNGAASSFSSRIDPAGQVLVSATRQAETGATGPGVLATVSFRVTAATTSETQVQLLSAAPVGPDGRPVPLPLPAPHALRLLNAKAP